MPCRVNPRCAHPEATPKSRRLLSPGWMPFLNAERPGPERPLPRGTAGLSAKSQNRRHGLGLNRWSDLKMGQKRLPLETRCLGVPQERRSTRWQSGGRRLKVRSNSPRDKSKRVLRNSGPRSHRQRPSP